MLSNIFLFVNLPNPTQQKTVFLGTVKCFCRGLWFIHGIYIDSTASLANLDNVLSWAFTIPSILTSLCR